jgi:putative membrane protein
MRCCGAAVHPSIDAGFIPAQPELTSAMERPIQHSDDKHSPAAALSRIMPNDGRLPLALLALYLLLFAVLAIDPVESQTWFVENVTVLLIVAAIGALWRQRIRFSNTAYLLMSVLIYLHTIGGHYTFAEVPFSWVTRTFGLERNDYDRVAHFSVGFYAFAVAEWLWAQRLVANRFLLFTYPVLVIAGVAMSYEVFEWLYAATAAPEAGAAYLGSQGDLWDAQKDMLADTLGAVAATAFFFAYHGPRQLALDLAAVRT